MFLTKSPVSNTSPGTECPELIECIIASIYWTLFVYGAFLGIISYSYEVVTVILLILQIRKQSHRGKNA